MKIESKDNRGVLLYLALHGPSIGNRIDSVSNASRASHNLEDRGLIETKYGIYEGYDRGVNLLWLTTKGIIYSIRYLSRRQELDAKDISQIAEHWPEHLPLVLGKWDFFVREGWGEWASKQIRQVSLSIVIVYSGMLDESEGRQKALRDGLLMPIYAWAESEMGQRLEIIFTNMFYSSGIGKTLQAQKFLDDCSKDPEIREYLLALAEEAEQHSKSFMQRSKKRLEALRKNNKK